MLASHSAPASAAAPLPAGSVRHGGHGHRLWDLLTAPAASVVRPEARRRARMLATLLLFLIVSAALLTWVIPWLVAPDQASANRTLASTGLFAVVVGLGIYTLARTRHFEFASVLTVFTTMAACTGSIVAAQGTVWGQDAAYFLALSVILSSVLLPVSMTALVIGVNLGVLVVLERFMPGFGAVDLSNAIAFVGFVSVLLLVTAYVRSLDLRQIQDQAHEIADSEQRYRSLFEASFEGLALHDDGRIIEVNHALAEMLRTEPRHLVGKEIDQLVVPDSRPHIAHKTITSAHETNEAIAERADGTTLHVEFISKPYLHRGHLVRVTAFRDITERKEAEAAREKSRELAAANRRLQEIDRLKTHILNTASHELNTPITPLRLQVHLLREGRLGTMNEKQIRAVDIVHRNLDRLHHLVKDMLDVSQLQAGRFEVRRVRLDLNTLILDAVDSYQDLAREHEVELHVDLPPETWIDGDPDRIIQVLHNLLSNAVKFTPPAGSVDVRLIHEDGHAAVTVADTGLGLSPEQRSHLFQPFGQVHGALQRTERGSGLGLYISKGIIERHGGTMRADSDGPGKGSAFTITFPLAENGATSEGNT